MNLKLQIKIILTALALCNLQDVHAQKENTMETQANKQAITAVLENNYFEGIYKGDVVLLGNAFHPEALLFGDIKGVPYAKTLGQYLDGVKNRQSPKDSSRPFKAEILSLQIINSIAVVQAKVTMYDFIYHDILSLHEINGKWVIVNKMFSDTNDK